MKKLSSALPLVLLLAATSAGAAGATEKATQNQASEVKDMIGSLYANPNVVENSQVLQNLESADLSQNPVTIAYEPVARPLARPIARPDARPVARPIARPDARPVARPDVRPVARPDVRPIARPDARPVIRPVARPASGLDIIK